MGRVHGATKANKRSTIGANVVLVCSELATLRGDTLQFLLRWGIGVADVHQKALLANRHAVKLLDHFVTNVSILEAVISLAS